MSVLTIQISQSAGRHGDAALLLTGPVNAAATSANRFNLLLGTIQRTWSWTKLQDLSVFTSLQRQKNTNVNLLRLFSLSSTVGHNCNCNLTLSLMIQSDSDYSIRARQVRGRRSGGLPPSLSEAADWGVI